MEWNRTPPGDRPLTISPPPLLAAKQMSRCPQRKKVSGSDLSLPRPKRGAPHTPTSPCTSDRVAKARCTDWPRIDWDRSSVPLYVGPLEKVHHPCCWLRGQAPRTASAQPRLRMHLLDFEW
eukprot:4970861-Prymnesium_polylepis.1